MHERRKPMRTSFIHHFFLVTFDARDSTVLIQKYIFICTYMVFIEQKIRLCVLFEKPLFIRYFFLISFYCVAFVRIRCDSIEICAWLVVVFRSVASFAAWNFDKCTINVPHCVHYGIRTNTTIDKNKNTIMQKKKKKKKTIYHLNADYELDNRRIFFRCWHSIFIDL